MLRDGGCAASLSHEGVGTLLAARFPHAEEQCEAVRLESLP